MLSSKRALTPEGTRVADSGSAHIEAIGRLDFWYVARTNKVDGRLRWSFEGSGRNNRNIGEGAGNVCLYTARWHVVYGADESVFPSTAGEPGAVANVLYPSVHQDTDTKSFSLLFGAKAGEFAATRDECARCISRRPEQRKVV